MKYQPLNPARLEFRGDVPVSQVHDDPYFSLEDGLAESRHVFIDGCDVLNQWSDRDCFTILETGFGTGLNCFATWQQWRQRRHRESGKNPVLHFISVEAHPLDAEQQRRALTPWPDLMPLVRDYQNQMPPPVPGFHRRWFECDGICLTLLYGDVLDCLSELEASVDAIYLDGFAPSQNEAMWQPAVFDELARLGHSETRLATFTSAGAVRRGLTESGFKVSKVPGFGRKREMVTAKLTSPQTGSRVPAWFSLPAPNRDVPQISGRGIAGASAARAWQLRGVDVCIEDAQIDRSASRNPLALVSPRLPAAISREGQLLLSSALYAKPQYQQAGCLRYQDVLVPETVRQDASQLQKVLNTWQLPSALLRPLDDAQMTEASGGQINCSGLYSAMGCAVDTAQLLDSWLPETQVTSPHSLNVLATGAALRARNEHFNEALHAMQGEVVYLDVDEEATLPLPLCGVGQLVQTATGQWQLGSSYRPIRPDLILTPQQTDHQMQQQVLDELEPVPRAMQSARIRGGRAAVRVRGADHLPLTGPIPDSDRYRETFSRLNHNARAVADESPPWLDEQWVLTGFGSHGYTFAPLLAELMVSQIRGEPWPLPRTLALAVHPARFLVRQLKRVPPDRNRGQR